MGKNPFSYSTHKRFLSGHMKISKELNSKRANNPINTWANKVNRQFLREVQ
jgi:hypothetical protein